MLGYVTQAAPLKVKTQDSSTSADATVISGSGFVPALNDVVICLWVSGRLYVLGGAAPGGGGGGGSMTKAEIDALGVDAGTLDGFDSTAFLRTKAQVDALGVDAGTLDGLDSLAFVKLDRFLRRRVSPIMSGGGIMKWVASGNLWSWSDLIRFIPAGGGGHIFNLSAGNVSVPNYNVAYLRPTDAQWVSGSTPAATFTAANIIVESYTTYVPQENDLILAYHNGDGTDDNLYLGNGNILSFWRNVTSYGTNMQGVTSPSYQGPQYRKRADGVVELRGYVQTISGTGGNGAVLFTLPAGFRPALRNTQGSWSYSGSAYQFARVDIAADGQVISIATTFTDISVGGITFMAEQ